MNKINGFKCGVAANYLACQFMQCTNSTCLVCSSKFLKKTGMASAFPEITAI